MDALHPSGVRYGLAALVLASVPVERGGEVDEQPELELAAPPEVTFDTVTQVNSDDPPPPEPRPQRTWSGRCADQSERWKGPMTITLEVSPPDGDDQLFIDGVLELAGRRARLRTYESGDYLPVMREPRGRMVAGTMAEIGGIHTAWDVGIHVDRVDATHLVGTLLEFPSDHSVNVICRFDWHR